MLKYIIAAKEVYMAEVVSFLPNHHKLETLIGKFVSFIEEEELQAYVRGWLISRTEEYYESLVSSVGQEDVSSLLAEIAFWKAVVALYSIGGKYALADKIGFMPPYVT